MNAPEHKPNQTIRRSLLKSLPAMLLLSPGTVGAETGNDRAGAEKSKADVITVALAEQAILGFFKTVILKRNLDRSVAFFVSKEQYMGLGEIEDSPEASREINFDYHRSMFVDDCSRLMDLIPKAGVDSIHLSKMEKQPRISGSNFEEGVEYKATFAFAEGGSRFQIVFPTAFVVEGEIRFATRVWVLIKYLL